MIHPLNNQKKHAKENFRVGFLGVFWVVFFTATPELLTFGLHVQREVVWLDRRLPCREVDDIPKSRK